MTTSFLEASHWQWLGVQWSLPSSSALSAWRVFNESKSSKRKQLIGGGQHHSGGHSLKPEKLFHLQSPLRSVAAKNSHSVGGSVTMSEWSIRGLVLYSSLGSVKACYATSERMHAVPWLEMHVSLNWLQAGSFRLKPPNKRLAIGLRL